MEEYHYYLVPNPAHTIKSSDLPPGALIFRIQTFFPNINEGDGPYRSIADLKTSSAIYMSLLQSDTKRAQKIVQERFIRTIKEMMPVPSGNNYKIDYI